VLSAFFLFLSCIFCFDGLRFFFLFRFVLRYFDKNPEKGYANLTDEACQTTFPPGNVTLAFLTFNKTSSLAPFHS
jgi:hypothetical protein